MPNSRRQDGTKQVKVTAKERETLEKARDLMNDLADIGIPNKAGGDIDTVLANFGEDGWATVTPSSSG